MPTIRPEDALVRFLEQTQDVALRPIVWVGAGASAAAGYPTLPALADLLRRHLPDAGEDDDGYALAGAYAEEYGKPGLSAFLQKHLGEPKRHTAIHQALARLAGAGVCPLLFTTNYDRLLENALTDEGVPHAVQVLESNFVLQATDDVHVLKLHGDLADWMNVVLTAASYEAFEASRPLLVRQLDLSLRTRPVLFIGCSMLDPRLLDWLAALSETERDQLHASRAVITHDDWGAVPAETQALLASARILPIRVDAYTDIPRILLVAAKKLAPLDVRELVFDIDPGEETWTVVGPTTEHEPHPTANPLLDEELLSLLTALRSHAGTPVVENQPDAALLDAQLRNLGRQVGERLTAVLFSDAARQAVIRRLHEVDRGRARLAVRVSESPLADRTLALPWELLMPEDGIFAVERGQLDVVREAVADGGPTLPEPTGPVRVGVTISAPEGQTALHYEAEQYRLHQALAPLGQQVAFSDLGGVDDLVEVVDGQQANVVHFSGHGLPGELVFEDEYGFADIVAVGDVVSKLNAKVLAPGHSFPLVFFLASCHGASGADQPEWQEEPEPALATRRARDLAAALGHGPSTAATLHRSGFVQVIGYFGPVGDDICTRAEEKFYRAVTRGETVLQAAHEARACLAEPFMSRGEAIHYPLAWAQLAVYHRGPDRPLATKGAVERTLPGRRFRREMVQVSGLPVLEFGFVGRRTLLHELRRKLRDGQRLFVIQGLGGLGKTALASHLLSKVLASNPADQLILHCSHLEKAADPVSDLRAQAEEHGSVHRLDNWEARIHALREKVPEPVGGFTATIAELRRERPNLVLYADNTEALQFGPKDSGEDKVGNWKPAAKPWWTVLERFSDDGVVLLSTRYFWDDLDPDYRLPIPPMSAADVLRMIEPWKHLGELPFDVAQKLAQRVDGHPRTVEILDGLIGERRLQLGHMPADVWGKLVEPILPKQAEKITADLLLAELWKRLSPEAQVQAIRIGVLQIPAPRFVVDKLGDRADELVRTSFLTRYRIPGFHADTRKLEWTDRWGLHSLVNDFVAGRTDDDARRSAQRMAGLAFKESVENPGALWSDQTEGIRLLHESHEGDEAFPMVRDYTFHLREHARYAEALALLHECEPAGVSGDRLAWTLQYLFQMRYFMGDRSAALQTLLERALSVSSSEKVKGFVFHGLGILLTSQGKYSEAESFLRKSIISKENTIGTENVDYAGSLHELARVVLRQGKHAESEELTREALDIQERISGKNTPGYATSLNNLATVLFRQRRLVEAEAALRESLRISEEILGRNHPDLAPPLNNLAAILAEKGKPDQGEPLIRRALGIIRDAVGTQSPEAAEILTLLAQVQMAAQNPEAPGTAQQALQSLVTTLGPNHPITQKSVPILQQIIVSGRLSRELEGLPPEDRQAQIVAIQARAVADNIRDGIVQTLLDGNDLSPLIDKLHQNVDAAVKNDDVLLASFFRAVLAVLDSDEPNDVPELLQEHVEIVRKVWNLSPEERQAAAVGARAKAVASQIENAVVQALQQGPDRGPVREELNRNLKIAEENDDALFASFFRALLAVLDGEEPEDVPDFLQEHVDAVREAVRQAES